jgi:hypothetical protein
MGTRGPLPKRDEARAGHRTKAERADKVTPPTPADGLVRAPVPDGAWHPQTLSFYGALRESGQSRFYEPSDWALAVMRCRIHSLIEYAIDEGALPPASLLAEISKIDARLGVTESDRRRQRIEVDREATDAAQPHATDDAVNAIMERYRRAAGDSD